MTLKRSTNYITFISGLKTNATEQNERIEALKDAKGWHLINQVDEIYSIPVYSLRAMLEAGSEIEQHELPKDSIRVAMKHYQ